MTITKQNIGKRKERRMFDESSLLDALPAPPLFPCPSVVVVVGRVVGSGVVVSDVRLCIDDVAFIVVGEVVTEADDVIGSVLFGDAVIESIDLAFVIEGSIVVKNDVIWGVLNNCVVRNVAFGNFVVGNVSVKNDIVENTVVSDGLIGITSVEDGVANTIERVDVADGVVWNAASEDDVFGRFVIKVRVGGAVVGVNCVFIA